MEVKNMRISVVKFENAYTMINGVLTLVKWKGVKFPPSYKAKHIVQLPSGNIDVLPVDTVFYASEEAFRANTPIAPEFYIDTPKMLERLGVNYECEKKDNGDTVLCPYVYIFDNGEPKKSYVNIFGITSQSPHQFKADEVISTKIGKNLTSWYKSHEDALTWNDYRVKDEDGTERLVRSRANALKLSEEQKELMNQIMNAIAKAHEGGIKFVWNSEEGVLIPVNTNGLDVKEVETYGDNVDVNLVRQDVLFDLGTPLNISDFWTNYDYGLSVKFK